MFKKLLIFFIASFISLNSVKASFDIKARTAILQDFHSGEGTK